MTNSLDVLGLSSRESTVFSALREGHQTPVRIGKETNISRPAIYAILKKLEMRHLAVKRTAKGSSHWEIAPLRAIDDAFWAAKRELTGQPEGKMELYRKSEATIVIYRGREAIAGIFTHIFGEHRGERVVGIQGDRVYPAWESLLGAESIGAFNRNIKKNRYIIEAILPEGFFPRVFSRMGMEWARDFEGRTYRASEIGAEYFDHGAEIFLFKESIYLASMSEALVIEIRHSEIQKMLALVLGFVQDNARTVDGNEALRKLMAQNQAASSS